MIEAKVKAVKEYTSYNGETRYITLIDAKVPVIVPSLDGTWELGHVAQIPGAYPIKATLEINPILLHEGDNFHDIIIQHDCYFYDVLVK